VHLVLPSAHSTTAKQREFVAFAAPLLRHNLATAAIEIGGSGSGAR
jgi:hypothetical protein